MVQKNNKNCVVTEENTGSYEYIYICMTNQLERYETHRPGRNACTRSNAPLIFIYFRGKKGTKNITRVYIIYIYISTCI